MLGVACADSASSPDSALDLGRYDGHPDVSAGEGGNALVLDFLTQGCAEQTESRCSGAAPLALGFVLISNQPTTPVGTWSFGDGSTAVGTSVQRVFNEPGTYSVNVTISYSGGTRAVSKTDFVAVAPVAAGGPCVKDAVCLSKRCVCNDGSCAAPLDSGFCLAACENAACVSGETCVLLGQSAKPAPAWRTSACLPTCAGDGDCSRLGFRCRLAPTSEGWRRACLPPFPADLGASCRDASGVLSPASCLGDVCLAFGASGYCSTACEVGNCPEGSGCVELAAGPSKRRVCLLRCAPGVCGGNPGLACRTPGGSGAYAFTEVGTVSPPGTMYCAARGCTEDGDCGLGGLCSAPLGGYCARP